MEGDPNVGKKMAAVALFLGTFLIAIAAFSKFYMYDRLAVVPFNTETTSIAATAPGADAEYLDIANGLKITTGPLRSVQIVKGDVDLSKKASKELDRDVAVWLTYSCTDVPSFDCASGKVPLSGTVDLVAFDRHTGETVDWKGSKSEADGEIISPAHFKGLYFKFPFDTQKKSYKFWEGTLQKPVDVKYVGEGKIEGLKVYNFEQKVDPIKTGTIDVPGDLVGSDEDTVTADRIYSGVRKYSVEPVTGVIVVGGESQDSYLELNGERVLTTTKASLEYTAENTKDTVNEYKGKAQLLSIVKTTLPLGGAIAGVLLLAFGLIARRGKSDDGARHSG